MPVLGEAANNPEIVLRHLFRSDLLRRFYYRWLLPIEGALSDNWLSRWHLNHVFLVKRGLGDRWRSRSDLVDLLSLRLDMSRLLPIKFALSGRGRNGYCPFQLYDLAIDKSVIGRAQLDNYGSRTDKTAGWSNPSVVQVRCRQLPRVAAERATS